MYSYISSEYFFQICSAIIIRLSIYLFIHEFITIIIFFFLRILFTTHEYSQEHTILIDNILRSYHYTADVGFRVLSTRRASAISFEIFHTVMNNDRLIVS